MVLFTLKGYGAPQTDIDRLEVVNQFDTARFQIGTEYEVKQMWVRIERVGLLSAKYEELARQYAIPAS